MVRKEEEEILWSTFHKMYNTKRHLYKLQLPFKTINYENESSFVCTHIPVTVPRNFGICITWKFSLLTETYGKQLSRIHNKQQLAVMDGFFLNVCNVKQFKYLTVDSVNCAVTMSRRMKVITFITIFSFTTSIFYAL